METAQVSQEALEKITLMNITNGLQSKAIALDIKLLRALKQTGMQKVVDKLLSATKLPQEKKSELSKAFGRGTL